jgi:hypothetical protein
MQPAHCRCLVRLGHGHSLFGRTGAVSIEAARRLANDDFKSRLAERLPASIAMSAQVMPDVYFS